jgi:hypothetical protein
VFPPEVTARVVAVTGLAVAGLGLADLDCPVASAVPAKSSAASRKQAAAACLLRLRLELVGLESAIRTEAETRHKNVIVKNP